MNWKKRFEAGRLSAGKIKVARESWVIVLIQGRYAKRINSTSDITANTIPITSK